MIDAYIITIDGNDQSENCAAVCRNSIEETGTELDAVYTHNATTPKYVEQDWDLSDWIRGIPWTWPRDPLENGFDKRTGIYKQAYTAADQMKKIACSISHIRLWELCFAYKKPILVLEHDAIFTRRFKYDYVSGYEWGALGLNNPIGATRRAQVFDDSARSHGHGVHPVPTVNTPFEHPVPQGLAGNSAYIIKPYAAEALLNMVRVHGIWPNDAQMCKELCPWLRISQPYYTSIQRTVSTTVN